MEKFKVGDSARISKNSNSFIDDFICCFNKGDIVEIISCFGNVLKCEREEDGKIQYVPIDCLEPLNNEKVIFNGNTTILLRDGKKYIAKCEDGDTYDREKGLLLCLAKSNGVNYKDFQEMIKNAKVHNKEKEKLKTKYKVGDFVEVIDKGKGYPIYDDWFKIYAPNLLENYKHWGYLSVEKTYRIVVLGKHTCYKDMLYGIEDFDKNVYLISESGLKLADVREVKRPVKVGEYVKVVDASNVLGNEYKNGDILKIVTIEGSNWHKAYYKPELGKFLFEYEYVVLENYK